MHIVHSWTISLSYSFSFSFSYYQLLDNSTSVYQKLQVIYNVSFTYKEYNMLTFSFRFIQVQIIFTKIYEHLTWNIKCICLNHKLDVYNPEIISQHECHANGKVWGQHYQCTQVSIPFSIYFLFQNFRHHNVRLILYNTFTVCSKLIP